MIWARVDRRTDIGSLRCDLQFLPVILNSTPGGRWKSTTRLAAFGAQLPIKFQIKTNPTILGRWADIGPHFRWGSLQLTRIVAIETRRRCM